MCRTFVERDQIERGFEDVAPVQTTIRLHTRMFSALHETVSERRSLIVGLAFQP